MTDEKKHPIKIIGEYANALLDIIYPPICLGCGETESGQYLCNSCKDEISEVAGPSCHVCGHTITGAFCVNCASRPLAFSKARAAGDYSGVLRKLVHAFKYHGSRCLASDLSTLMYEYAAGRSDLDLRAVDCLIPVPIHAIRKRVRGYNQSELLAEGISRLSGIPTVSDAMARVVYTNPQVALSREQRMTNMKSAFKVIAPDKINSKRILLIDDVSTTSSTVYECSRILLDAGANDVQVLCLAFDA
jgi:competence protein ComFC